MQKFQKFRRGHGLIFSDPRISPQPPSDSRWHVGAAASGGSWGGMRGNEWRRVAMVAATNGWAAWAMLVRACTGAAESGDDQGASGVALSCTPPMLPTYAPRMAHPRTMPPRRTGVCIPPSHNMGMPHAAWALQSQYGHAVRGVGGMASHCGACGRQCRVIHWKLCTGLVIHTQASGCPHTIAIVIHIP